MNGRREVAAGGGPWQRVGALGLALTKV